MTQRELRSKERVDYVALHNGNDTDGEGDVFHESFTEQPLSSVLSPHEATVASLEEEVAAAKAERDNLVKEAELQRLKEELREIRSQSDDIRASKSQRSKSTRSGEIEGVPGEVDRVRRVDPKISRAVEKKLVKFGISSDSSSEDSEEDYASTRRRKERGKLRSGKLSKVTNRVVCPQLWPHSELSLSYVSKDIKYEDLTLAEFVAGYTTILGLLALSSREKEARLEHLNSLMYLATKFPWHVVRSFHAAVLFEIERGRARWGDSFTQLENRFMHNAHSEKFIAQSSKPASSRGTFFCKEFQSGKCSNRADHFGLFRNERKWLQHICGTCWTKEHKIEKHAESSSTCPLKSGSQAPKSE